MCQNAETNHGDLRRAYAGIMAELCAEKLRPRGFEISVDPTEEYWSKAHEMTHEILWNQLKSYESPPDTSHLRHVWWHKLGFWQEKYRWNLFPDHNMISTPSFLETLTLGRSEASALLCSQIYLAKLKNQRCSIRGMFQYVPICSNMFQYVPICSNMFQCIEVSERHWLLKSNTLKWQ